MALKCVYIGGCSKAPQLRAANLQPGNSGLIMSLRYDLEKCRKWECCCLGVLAQKAAIPIEDDKKPTVTGAESSGPIAGVQDNESRGFLNLLPSELYPYHISQKEISHFMFYQILENAFPDHCRFSPCTTSFL